MTKTVSNISTAPASPMNRSPLLGLPLCRFVRISEFLKTITEKFTTNVASSENSGNTLQSRYNGRIPQFVETTSDFTEDRRTAGSNVLSVTTKNTIPPRCRSDIP